MSDAEFDAVAYWEDRHRGLVGDHRNVGNRGLSSSQNFDLLINKAVHVAYELGALGVPKGARVLDAGCGAGAFIGFLHEAGFEMTGVDVSETAIAAARATTNASYDVAGIGAYEPASPFDVVLCLDVLFHVIDDDEWRAAMKRLSGNVKEGGYLFVIEFFPPAEMPTAAHVRLRSLRTYEEVLPACGLRLAKTVCFQYPHERQDKTLIIAQKRGAAPA